MFIAKLPWQKNCAQIDNQYKTDLAIFSLTLGVVVKTIVTVLIVEIYVSSYSLSCVSMILDEFEKCFHFICFLCFLICGFHLTMPFLGYSYFLHIIRNLLQTVKNFLTLFFAFYFLCVWSYRNL